MLAHVSCQSNISSTPSRSNSLSVVTNRLESVLGLPCAAGGGSFGTHLIGLLPFHSEREKDFSRWFSMVQPYGPAMDQTGYLAIGNRRKIDANGSILCEDYIAASSHRQTQETRLKTRHIFTNHHCFQDCVVSLVSTSSSKQVLPKTRELMEASNA